MSHYKLLTDANPKIRKGEKRGWLTASLMLAPARTSGLDNLCRFASPGCMGCCLFTAGRGRMPPVQEARIRRARLLLQDPIQFSGLLRCDLETLTRSAERLDMDPAVRLNCTSDVAWERAFPALIPSWPDLQFYDYTKDHKRYADYLRGWLPKNYYLTFSRSELNEEYARGFAEAGGNSAVVFDALKGRPLPPRWEGIRVVDGDVDDLRFLDPPGTVIGLRAKGRAIRDTTGFVVRHAQEMALKAAASS